MHYPGVSLEPTGWANLVTQAAVLADSSTFAPPSELQQEADAHAAQTQPSSAAPAAATPTSSSIGTLQQQQQQQSHGTSAAGAFVPVNELPTFELTDGVDWQNDRQAAAGAAAAAATMSAVQQFAAEDVSMYLPDVHQQTQQQTLQPGAAAASANGHSSSQNADTAAASATVDPDHSDWGQQQPRFAAVAAAAGAGSTAASHSGPSSAAAAAVVHDDSAVQLLLTIDEAAASALQSALQQQDDQQLMREAAAVSAAAAASAAGFGAVGGGGAVQLDGYGWAAGAADDAAGLAMPDLSTGEAWREDLTAVTQLKHLDLEDKAQQQQQPLVPPGFQQQQQLPQAGQHHQQWQQQQQQRELHGQLYLNELLEAGGGSAMVMDREAGEIPVLQLPRPQQPRHDAAHVVLPGIGQQQPQRQQGGDNILDGFKGSAWGVNGGAFEAEEGIGPHMFGLPVEAPPAFPDEPVQLLQVSQNPSESFLL
jgi:hypothetical protein